jgi:hypothetical protein
MLNRATLLNTEANSKKFVSGLCMVVAAATIGILGSAPAHATLLNGGIEVSDTVSTPADTTGSATPGTVSGAGPTTTVGANPAADNNFVPSQAMPQIRAVAPTLQPRVPTVAYGRTPNIAQLTPPLNSFPADYSGRWQCVTRVIDSAIDSVAIGTELKSEVCFVDVPDGRVLARWVQPGWTETQASAMSWSSREAQTDRTSYYFGEGMNGSWASRSRDHFMQVATDRLECKSYVDQYMDGRYIGRYRTISVLSRIGTVNTIAQGAKSEK